MKQVFDERHIGCPVIVHNSGGEIIGSPMFYTTTIECYTNTCTIELDIAHIFRMLDADPTIDFEIGWIAMDDLCSWYAFEHEPELNDEIEIWEQHKKVLFYSAIGRFRYWPSPLPWNESKWQRPEESNK